MFSIFEWVCISATTLRYQAVRSVDVQQNDFAVAEMQVSSLPHLIMYNHGEKVGEVVGANPQQICDLVRSVVRQDLPHDFWQAWTTTEAAATAAAATLSISTIPTASIASGKHVLNLSPTAGRSTRPTSSEIASQLQVCGNDRSLRAGDAYHHDADCIIIIAGCNQSAVRKVCVTRRLRRRLRCDESKRRFRRVFAQRSPATGV